MMRSIPWVLPGRWFAWIWPAATPDGRYAISGSLDRTVRLWDLAGSELLTLTENNSDSAPIAFSNPDRANLLEETPVAGIHFRAGVNPLVFKVLNETGGWRGSIRFTDASSQPVSGLRVVLEPDPKE